MNLNLIAGSFSRMGFLLSWETIRANQLWTQPFHKSYFRAAPRGVPRLIPVLPQTRQPPTTFPKRNWEYWFGCVIIIAFINRGCKTEQSPLQDISPQGRARVCVLSSLNMSECIYLMSSELIWSSRAKVVNNQANLISWIGPVHLVALEASVSFILGTLGTWPHLLENWQILAPSLFKSIIGQVKSILFI